MSVLERLVQGASGGDAAAAPRTPVADAGDTEAREVEISEPEEGAPKTAAERARALLLGASSLEAECSKIATDLRGEMEKTASEGGDTSEQEDTAAFFEKIAETLRIQRVYAANVVKQAAGDAKRCEALKLASDLMQRDLLEVEEGQSLLQVVEGLSKRNLDAVKVASEMFTDRAVAAIGTAEKMASDKGESRKVDGLMPSWMEAHRFLLD